MTVTTSDLATYLNDPRLDTTRAQKMIDRATTLCQLVVSPLPASADVVVERVAARGYVTAPSSRQQQLSDAGSPFAAPGGGGGIYLTQTDRRDLRASSGGGGAFTIDTLPAGYVLTQPWWDSAAEVAGDFDSPV